MSAARFDLPAEIAEVIAGRPRPLLVGCDVDGTLAPIAPRPEQARLAPGALDVLGELGRRAGVDVAVVSGRSLTELREHFGLGAVAHLVGSHGAESVHAPPPDADEARLLAEVHEGIAGIVERVPGAALETKPLAAALHVRGATPDGATEALAAARALFADDARVEVHEGHQVFEVAVRHVTKAGALAELRARLTPATVLFVGDDRSDETAFSELGDGDVGVKVGVGPTAARWRLATPADVVELLRRLADALT